MPHPNKKCRSISTAAFASCADVQMRRKPGTSTHLHNFSVSKFELRIIFYAKRLESTRIRLPGSQKSTAGAFKYMIVGNVTYGISFKLKIQKALETVRRVQGTLLTIASDHGQQLVRDSEILYIEVQGHNLIYHTLHGDLTATGTLKQIEAQLKPSGFYRCNYCYLVNLRHVGFLDGSEVTVGQYKLQISRNRRKEFLQQLTQFYGRGGR